jgi:hypothetical protein
VERRSTGLSESPLEFCDDGAFVVAESPGAISARGVLSSELETARRRRLTVSLLLGELSEVLEEEALEELPPELLADELLSVLSELDDARRNRGRSGSSLFELGLDELEFDVLRDELFDEVLALSSELDAARRSVGFPELLPPVAATEESLAGLLDDVLAEEDEPSDGRSGSGRVGSSAATDAMECSSAVPSETIVILTAW